MTFLAKPAATTAGSIQNDGWWPDIDLLDLRKSARLDGTVTDERLINATATAITSVNTELAGWKATQVAAGYAGLGAVPSPQLAGASVLYVHYRRAVYSLTQADLIERYRDYDTTGAGDKRAASMEPRIDDHRRDARWAISDLQSRRRTTVELI
jgi:hypothetical protein